MDDTFICHHSVRVSDTFGDPYGGWTLKVYFFAKDGRCYVEEVKPNTMLFEKFNGLYVISGESIYKDVANRYPPMAVIFQDVVDAEGLPRTSESVDSILGKIDIASMAGQKVPKSGELFRGLGRLQGTAPMLILIGFFIVIAFAILTQPGGIMG